MANHISPWETLEREQAEKSRAAFEARSDFQELITQAAARGFRRITLAEQLKPSDVNAYNWRGGVWIKNQ
jgi:hypothetical protein